MTRVRLLVGRATSRGPEHIGMVISVPADEAMRMIDAGQAEMVRDPNPAKARRAKPEKAVKRAKPEKAVR